MSELVSGSSVNHRGHGPRLQSIAGRLRRSAWLACACIEEHRKAQAAERLHQNLSHMSDGDLARLGTKQNEITQYLRERLYR